MPALLQDPYKVWLRGVYRIAPAHLADSYGRKARAQGLDRLYFILSFDCDTEEDAAVAWDVHSRLADMGVTPVYAICGDLLRQGANVYRRIFESGAQFINHGDLRHTYFDESVRAYRPCFFYHQQTRARVEQDIRAADATLREVLGITPQGFRAPHFGTYQSADDIAFKHGVARSLGYKFCTTTVPYFGLRYGPALKSQDLYEFPVSARGSNPLVILDSWGGLVKGTCSYLSEARRSADFYQWAGAGLLNFYADPSHVAGNEEFFVAVKLWADIARPVNYTQLVDILEDQ